MREASIGCLVVTVVTNEEKVEGIITDRDLTVRCLTEGHNPLLCPVSQHMSRPVITAGPGMDVLYAAHLMSNKKIKRLPVVEGDQLIGLVSFSDIANAMIQPMSHLLAGLGASKRRI
jgi:signal-transduction protein with cAMP-binding, CBS, and nucleotidyltransferase domain